MDNPWFNFFIDFKWVITNPILIFRFLYENSILAISFNNLQEIDHINGNLAELYFFNLQNWFEVIKQFFLTIIILLFPPLYFLLRILQSIYYKNNFNMSNNLNNNNVISFFINGICVNSYWENQNCERIIRRLGQEHIGILTPISNPSYGIIADIFESITQRSFKVNTTSVCVATNVIEQALRNSKSNDIIRFISHSQGTIIANLVIQKLYYNLSLTGNKYLLNRLHVHTFACASKNFINPEKLLGCLEHYVNINDPVAILGILNTFPEIPKNYNGNIFINFNGSGHLFNRYYSLKRNNYTSITNRTPILLPI
jgi:hypothetical protein